MLEIDKINQVMLHFSLCKGLDATQRIMMGAILMEEPNVTLAELADRAGIKEKQKELFYVSYSAINLEQIIEDYKKLGIQWVSFFDASFPHYLRHIYDPPSLLFYKGNIDLLKENLLSVVGSRAHSRYAAEVLEAFVPRLIDNDFVLVSGLAKGVDTLTHQLTIKHLGKTIAVIGCGLDQCYPYENKALQEIISKEHLLLSEYPAGTKPLRHHFPMRNRIIAGISLGTLVIEAKYRSGSLITANIALKEGREVFAVPGNITSPFSGGTNDLIVQGAICVLSGEMLVENYLK